MFVSLLQGRNHIAPCLGLRCAPAGLFEKIHVQFLKKVDIWLCLLVFPNKGTMNKVKTVVYLCLSYLFYFDIYLYVHIHLLDLVFSRTFFWGGGVFLNQASTYKGTKGKHPSVDMPARPADFITVYDYMIISLYFIKSHCIILCSVTLCHMDYYHHTIHNSRGGGNMFESCTWPFTRTAGALDSYRLTERKIRFSSGSKGYQISARRQAVGRAFQVMPIACSAFGGQIPPLQTPVKFKAGGLSYLWSSRWLLCLTKGSSGRSLTNWQLFFSICFPFPWVFSMQRSPFPQSYDARDPLAETKLLCRLWWITKLDDREQTSWGPGLKRAMCADRNARW